MAIALEDKPNVVAPGGDYPYGRIKDDTGLGDGTPVNTEVYGDFHQFFAKLLADAGIAANGDPENSSDGFQYNEALMKLMAGDWIVVGSPQDAGQGYTTGWSAFGPTPLKYRIEGRTVRVFGGFQGNSINPVFELPIGFAPAVNVQVGVMCLNDHYDWQFEISVDPFTHAAFMSLLPGTGETEFFANFTIPLG